MLCSSLNLPTLAARSKQMKLGLLYRIIGGLAYNLSSAPISTRDNPKMLKSPHIVRISCKDKQLQVFFSPDVVELWNLLPSNAALTLLNLLFHIRSNCVI